MVIQQNRYLTFIRFKDHFIISKSVRYASVRFLLLRKRSAIADYIISVTLAAQELMTKILNNKGPNTLPHFLRGDIRKLRNMNREMRIDPDSFHSSMRNT